MAIPNYQELMLPLLQCLEESESHIQALTAHLSDRFSLTEEERAILLPSGRGVRLIHSRVHWARTYLVQAGLIESVRRGVVRITPLGRTILAAPPKRITNEFLMRFDAFRAFKARSHTIESATDREPPIESVATLQPPLDARLEGTPQDRVEQAITEIESLVRADLLKRLLGASPEFFERVIVDLLLAMGYGSTAEDAGERIGRSGDGGVDGVIREDRLGLDVIYLQGKRYAETPISADQIRSFAGSLDDYGARKGVFITTSRFTVEAVRFAQRQQTKRIVLIDGERLTRLMLRHDVGVRADRTIVLKRIDREYFPFDDMEDA